MESVVHMYILQNRNMQTYSNINDSQPGQLQHKTYKFGTWSQRTPLVQNKWQPL